MNSETNEPVTQQPTTQQFIDEWYLITQQLKTLKEREAVLRQYLAALVLEGKTEGASTKIIDGIELKATGKLYYSVNKAVLANVRDELTDPEIQAITYKPEVALKFFRKLPADSVIRKSVVTVKPGLPSLEIITA